MFFWLEFAAIIKLGDFMGRDAQARFQVPSLKKVQTVVIALYKKQQIPF